MSPLGYRRYLLGVLLVIFAFNNVDRLALGLLLQDIKTDLALTDTQLGLLTGIAFALFYVAMGIPIARWADRGNRVSIIAITTALWSAAVALCGAAGNFVQLLLIRVGAAVGEAGCIPPAHSLMADYFSRAERPRAVSIYMLGGPLSAVIGFFLAGWLNEFYGWRVTFVVLGMPGIALAALAWFTLREPRRGKQLAPAIATAPGYEEVLLALWANEAFRHLVLFNSIACFFGYGIQQWLPAFFVRTYGLQTGELGTWMTLISGAAGFLGTYWGGLWASRHAAGNESRQLKVVASGYASFGLVSMFLYLSPNHYLAFCLLGLAFIGTGVASGPLYATLQTLVPAHMRATALALVYLFGNLIGLGFGPLLAGVLSDGLRPWVGEESIRYALLILSPGYFWAAYHLMRASRTVARDLEEAGV